MPILYSVKEIIQSPNAITEDQAKLLFEEVKIAINSNHRAAIDFSGIKSYSKGFTTHSIEKLYIELSPTKFKSLIEIRNFS
jgi:hypothetical protein